MPLKAGIVLNFLLLTSELISYNSANSSINTKYNKTDLSDSQALESSFQSPQGRELVTDFDALSGVLRIWRENGFSQYNPESSLRHNVRLGKVQRQIPKGTPFPCDLKFARSSKPPTTVHELRPGDIDIIAAMGDSVSAGSSLMTESFTQLYIENRGLAFSGGGYGNWRKFLTLPNILKVFNPKLYGYAIADGFTFVRTSRFNVAEPAAMSRDLVHQAKILIKRMRRDPKVDMNRHWKLITIFIGNLDFCLDYCLYDDVTVPLRQHERDMREALTLLRKNLPRVFVNLLPAPNAIEVLKKMRVPLSCYVAHRFCFCCTNSNLTEADHKAYGAKLRLWQDLDAHIASLDEFNTDDFTVVFHSFFTKPQLKLLPNGFIDLRYFGADCFHFSQLGHASLANSLWNSMMEPFGQKQRNFHEVFESFECPSFERPYLATKKNSGNVSL